MGRRVTDWSCRLTSSYNYVVKDERQTVSDDIILIGYARTHTGVCIMLIQASSRRRFSIIHRVRDIDFVASLPGETATRDFRRQPNRLAKQLLFSLGGLTFDVCRHWRRLLDIAHQSSAEKKPWGIISTMFSKFNCFDRGSFHARLNVPESQHDLGMALAACGLAEVSPQVSGGDERQAMLLRAS
ncbi:hypothetical protein VTO42DRAFT_7186 [Malbranchea cinnamomea]